MVGLAIGHNIFFPPQPVVSCNIIICTVAMDTVSLALQSPSIYSGCRKRALKYTLDTIFSSLDNSSEPLYIYGDFNFRLDFAAVVKVGRGEGEGEGGREKVREGGRR